MKIPDNDKRISIPNNSDLFGNIWYTKNIDLDEEGYIKLASRSVAIYSERDDANFGIPLAFGKYDEAELYVTTGKAGVSGRVFNVNLLESGQYDILQNENSNSPSCTVDSSGVWWQNRWHTTTTGGLRYTDSPGATWANKDTEAALTSSVAHPLCVFKNKNELAIGNGNTVKLLDSSYALTTTLTIPADHEVIGLKWSNNLLGIITRLGDAAEGQNQDSFFFTWDGSDTEADSGVPIGSDAGVDVSLYGGSFVVTTRKGQKLFWTGGGFTSLTNLPIYVKRRGWGTLTLPLSIGGDSTINEGDLLYSNTPNNLSAVTDKKEYQLQNFPAGIYCYDPKVGLYHKYSYTNTYASFIEVEDSDVDTSTNILTVTSGTLNGNLGGIVGETGSQIRYLNDGNDPIGGLVEHKLYYLIRMNATSFKVAETYQDALNSNAIDLTSQGASSNYFVNYIDRDYGITYNPGIGGGVSSMGSQNDNFNHLIFGADVQDYASTNDKGTLMVTVSGLKNIGYFVLTKLESQEITDIWQKIYVKFKPLGADDKIIVKKKIKELYGLPVSVPQQSTNNFATWEGDNVIETEADLSAAKSYFDAGVILEIEITGGAGAGQMSKITGLDEVDGAYTITIEDVLIGVAQDYRCSFIIDNWEKIREITNANTDGYDEIQVGDTSKAAKFKVELHGVDTTIEDIRTEEVAHKLSA